MKELLVRGRALIVSSVVCLSATLITSTSFGQWRDVVEYNENSGFPLSVGLSINPKGVGSTQSRAIPELNLSVKDFRNNYGYLAYARISRVDSLGRKTPLNTLQVFPYTTYQEPPPAPGLPVTRVQEYRLGLFYTNPEEKLTADVYLYQVTDGVIAPSPFWGQIRNVVTQDGLSLEGPLASLPPFLGKEGRIQ
jgi:hypothetical protein